MDASKFTPEPVSADASFQPPRFSLIRLIVVVNLAGLCVWQIIRVGAETAMTAGFLLVLVPVISVILGVGTWVSERENGLTFRRAMAGSARVGLYVAVILLGLMAVIACLVGRAPSP